MAYFRDARVAYSDQRKSAIKRGVGWQFTYEDWVAWWMKHLGQNWFEKRGHKTGQYVMARNGDAGPYAEWNIRCALVEENHNDYNYSKPSQLGKPHRKRLSDAVVVNVYTMNGTYRDIAEQVGLTVHDVHRIKCRKAYKALTERLEKGCRD